MCLRALLGLSAVLGLGGCSREPDLPPDQAIALGATEITYFNFEKAGHLFEQALAKVPAGSPQWAEAAFGLAVCLQQALPPSPQDLARATQLYQAVADQAPDSRFAARALMNLGRIAELRDFPGDPPDLPRARTFYEQVIARWPTDPIAGEAALRVAGSYIQTHDRAQSRQGVAILERWLAEHPADPLASGMWQYLGDTYAFQFEDRARAVACFRRAVDVGLLERDRAGQVLWKAARLADQVAAATQPADQPRFRDEAVRFYTAVVTDAPNSGKAYQAQLRLKELGAPVPRIRLMIAAPDEAVPTAPASAPATQPGGAP